MNICSEKLKQLREKIKEVEKRSYEEKMALRKEFKKEMQGLIVKHEGKYYTNIDTSLHYSDEIRLTAYEVISNDMETADKPTTDVNYGIANAEIVEEVKVSNEKFNLIGATIKELEDYLTVKGFYIKAKAVGKVSDKWYNRVTFSINVIEGGLELKITEVRNLSQCKLLSTSLNTIKKLSDQTIIKRVIYQESCTKTVISCQSILVDPTSKEQNAFVLQPLEV